MRRKMNKVSKGEPAIEELKDVELEDMDEWTYKANKKNKKKKNEKNKGEKHDEKLVKAAEDRF